jgi:hypothetical protein
MTRFSAPFFHSWVPGIVCPDISMIRHRCRCWIIEVCCLKPDAGKLTRFSMVPTLPVQQYSSVVAQTVVPPVPRDGAVVYVPNLGKADTQLWENAKRCLILMTTTPSDPLVGQRITRW